MLQPQEVTDLDIAFGANIEKLMPKGIPKDFYRGRTEQNDIVSKWFYNGLPKGTEFIPKEGIDKNKALRHIKAILVSFEPSHEDKEASCAYLLSQWFEKVIIPGAPNNRINRTETARKSNR